MRTATFASVLALTMAAGGCATQHELVAPLVSLGAAGLIQDQTEARRLERAMTDGEIAHLLDVDVRAKLPTKLAVAKLGDACGSYQPRLDRISAEELEKWQAIVARQGGLRGVHPVSNLSFGDRLDGPSLTLRSLRVAAARMGCELLLVYMQGHSSVENYNNAAALYWTFVGLWLVPGNVVEHQTIAQAILVDCRTGMILGTATGDARDRRTIPAAYSAIAHDQLRTACPAEALEDLRDGCKALLSEVVARAEAEQGA